jgi:hypothetical protein
MKMNCFGANIIKSGSKLPHRCSRRMKTPLLIVFAVLGAMAALAKAESAVTGRPYDYNEAAKFKDGHGTGKRIGPRVVTHSAVQRHVEQ